MQESDQHGQRPLLETMLQIYAEQVGRAYGWLARRADWAARRASEYGQEASAQGRLAYRRAADQARVLSVKTRRQLAWARQERPLETLGILCGIGMAAGIALRVWRSQKP